MNMAVSTCNMFSKCLAFVHFTSWLLCLYQVLCLHGPVASVLPNSQGQLTLHATALLNTALVFLCCYMLGLWGVLYECYSSTAGGNDCQRCG